MVHPSRPFQFKPPNEAIYLNPDKPNYSIAQPIYHFNPSFCSMSAITYHLLSTSNLHHTRPIQLQPNPLTQPFQLSSNPALLSINPYSRTSRKSPRSPLTTRFHPYYTRNSNPSSPPVPSINSPDAPYYTRNSNTSSPPVPSINSPDASHHSIPLKCGLGYCAVHGSTLLISAGLDSLLGTVNQSVCVHGSPPIRALIRKTSVSIAKSKEVSRTWKRKSKGVEGFLL
jgi:hypothetical protein